MQFDDVALANVTGLTASVITSGSIVSFGVGGETVVQKAFYTPLLDYSSDPSNPTSTGKNLVWKDRDIIFRKVYSDNYCHYSASLLVEVTASY